MSCLIMVAFRLFQSNAPFIFTLFLYIHSCTLSNSVIFHDIFMQIYRTMKYVIYQDGMSRTRMIGMFPYRDVYYVAHKNYCSIFLSFKVMPLRIIFPNIVLQAIAH